MPTSLASLMHLDIVEPALVFDYWSIDGSPASVKINFIGYVGNSRILLLTAAWHGA